MDQLLKIHLFGQAYTFRTDTSATQAEAVAALLMDEVERIAAGSGGTGSEMNKLTLMILAALNFANENYELKLNRDSGEQGLTQRASRIVRVLDSALERLGRGGVSEKDARSAPTAAI